MKSSRPIGLAAFATACMLQSSMAQNAGTLTAERWTALPASPSVLTLQQQGIAKRTPNASGLVTAAGSFGALGDNFGLRLRGTIIPPISGAYTFYVAGDDNTQLWISPDSSRFNKELVAWNHAWTAREQWDKYPTQRSLPVNLVAGQAYYIEAQMQEWGGLESLAIGWSRENNWALASNGATATQSGTAYSGAASRAIDGNTNGNYNNNSVTHTTDAANSWWQVDFGQTRTINRVAVFNRDSIQTRLSNFRISALNEAGVELAGQSFFAGSGNAGASLTWEMPAFVDARKVKIQLLGRNNDNNGFLSLAEVQVSEYVPTPPNWCLATNGGTASQSGTAYSGAASRAIDGNTNGNYNNNSVTHTTDAANSWWQVDFGQNRPVNRIVLHNRDSNQGRLSNFRISMLDAAGVEVSGENFFTTSGSAGDSFLWNLPAEVTARKVKIQILGKNRDNNGFLSIAEVQAFQANPRADSLAKQLVPACYLTSLAPEPLDLDDDNLPDAFEQLYGINANSAIGLDGQYGDFDNDGISNFEEYQLGSNPAVKDALADGLTRERWFEITGDEVANLTGNRARFLREPNERIHVPGIHENVDGDNVGTRYRGAITAPVSGDYTFWISGDDEAELWLADGSIQKNLYGVATSLSNRYGKQRLAQVKDERFGIDYTAESDFDRFATQRSRAVTLVAGHSYYFEVLHKEGGGSAHVSVAWQLPGSARSIIPATAFTSDIPENDDRDDDNLPAAWETQYGLNPNDNGITDARDGQYGDWDADGLNNLEEYQLGTDPKKADTDNDTMSDKDERDYYHSDPLVSNLLNTTLHSTVNITGFTSTSVPWETRADGSILAHERRGWTDYQFTVLAGEEGIYEARITGGAEGGAVRSVENLPLSFHLDGGMLSRQTMRCLLGQNTTLKQMTPWLNAGVHTLRVQNHNTRADCKLRLNSISIHHLGGADADSDNIPDWVEQQLANENALTRIPAESRTSPACIEGVTSSLTALGISNTITGPDGQPATQPQEVLESVNHGFYSNIPLDPAAGTALTVSFQNDARVENHTIIWTVTNILAQSTLTLRKGDALKLTAHAPDATAAGAFTLTHNGQPVTTATGSTSHDASQPFVIAFDTPGTHTLTATWTPPDGNPRTGTLTVTAREADFGPAFAVQTYNRRTWTIPGVNGMDIETNSDIAWNETTTAGATARSFVVDIYQSGSSNVIARLPETGDIIARGILNAFTIAKVGETSDAQLVLIRPDGSRVYRFTIVAENLPANAEVRLRTYFQGAIFSNGSRDLVLRAGDFSSNGTANVLIEWGDATPHRICHTVRTYIVD